MDTYIEELTAENLEKAIADAIKRQEEAEGVTAVSFSEQKESYSSEELDYDKLIEEINEVGSQLAENERVEEVVDIIEKYLGKGKKVSEAKKSQVEVLAVILDQLKDLLSE
jgi:ribosomal protein L11 methylase PrmA